MRKILTAIGFTLLAATANASNIWQLQSNRTAWSTIGVNGGMRPNIQIDISKSPRHMVTYDQACPYGRIPTHARRSGGIEWVQVRVCNYNGTYWILSRAYKSCPGWRETYYTSVWMNEVKSIAYIHLCFVRGRGWFA